ncbi:autoinducer 2 sensor kinase phosphatase luxq [Stemphylium lycopersici]|nr:autoinducer 2 sensor kinase phosphatase luxq [Stemphylium lycopersici]
MTPQPSEFFIYFQVFCIGLMTMSYAFHGLVQRTVAAPLEPIRSSVAESMTVSVVAMQAPSMAASLTGANFALPTTIGAGGTSAFAMPSRGPGMVANASNGVPATVTQTSLLPYETMGYGWDPPTKDIGYTYGNATINNGCEESFNLMLVGGFRLGGLRVDKDGWDTPEEQVVYSIPAGGSYSEPYRMTYISADNSTGYNAATDKLWGQGISLKIYWADRPGDMNHTQFEYGLNNNPKNNLLYPELWYDVSLLDCGHAEKPSTLDYNATELDWQRKMEQCPGYQGGLTVRFEEACGSSADSCEEIDCAGECSDVYNFDRSRELEPTKQCAKEYKGNVMLNLCAGVR